jgi:hypothetical protein
MLGFSAAVFRDSRLILEISLMIRDVDLLRDDQWERLREFVPGGCKRQAGTARRQSPVSERAVVDGAFRRALARFCPSDWATTKL